MRMQAADVKANQGTHTEDPASLPKHNKDFGCKHIVTITFLSLPFLSFFFFFGRLFGALVLLAVLPSASPLGKLGNSIKKAGIHAKTSGAEERRI